MYAPLVMGLLLSIADAPPSDLRGVRINALATIGASALMSAAEIVISVCSLSSPRDFHVIACGITVPTA